MSKLKYSHYDVVFQEVPNEVSLAINISGCPHHCEGCHSQYLWEYKGNYISDDMDDILDKYKGMITCVCFMGGDQNEKELSLLLKKVRHEYGLKTALYTGSKLDDVQNILLDLDYIKVGKYIEKLGGINISTTNQRFYKILCGDLVDITKIFK